MKPYHHIEILKNIYFEDSFVRSITYDGNVVVFHLDIVLLESHEQYSPPRSGEQYCYRLATLSFNHLLHVDWRRVYMRASTDADGEIDFGNIDSFLCDQDIFYLSGDWGELEVQCGDLGLTLAPL